MLDAEESAVHIPGVVDMDEEGLARAFSGRVRGAFRRGRCDHRAASRFIPEIVHCHYRHGDNEFYFFVNTAKDRRFDASISLDTIGVPAIWNAETGDVAAMESYDYDGARTTFPLTFEPCESYVISVTTLPVGDEIVEIEREPKYGRIIELADTWEFTTEKPNALPLTSWQFSMGNPAKKQ